MSQSFSLQFCVSTCTTIENCCYSHQATMENEDLLTIAASIAVIVWSVVMNTLYNAEQHREKMASEGRAVASRLRGNVLQQVSLKFRLRTLSNLYPPQTT